MSKDLLAAQRYAQALFELSRELGKDELVEEELENLSSALKRSPDIEKFLANPALKTGEKAAFLQKLYPERNQPVHGMLVDFFKLLFEKDRFYLLHEIALYFKRIADDAQGQAVAELRSSSPLGAEAERTITQRLERIAGRKITVQKNVDPSLIGGVVVSLRNRVIDDSVKNKIRLIKKELTKIQSI